MDGIICTVKYAERIAGIECNHLRISKQAFFPRKLTRYKNMQRRKQVKLCMSGPSPGGKAET
jgi:hypothetical protein